MLSQKEIQFLVHVLSKPTTELQGLQEASLAVTVAHKLQLMFNELGANKEVAAVEA